MLKLWIVFISILGTAAAFAQNRLKDVAPLMDFSAYYTCLNEIWKVTRNDDLGPVFVEQKRGRADNGVYVFDSKTARYLDLNSGDSVLVKTTEKETGTLLMAKRGPSKVEVEIVDPITLSGGGDASYYSSVSVNAKKVLVKDIPGSPDDDARKAFRLYVIGQLKDYVELAKQDKKSAKHPRGQGFFSRLFGKDRKGTDRKAQFELFGAESLEWRQKEARKAKKYCDVLGDAALQKSVRDFVKASGLKDGDVEEKSEAEGKRDYEEIKVDRAISVPQK